MNCKDALDFLQDYIDGRLEPGLHQRFKEHLAACPPCIDYMESYEATAALSRKACDETCDELPHELFSAILKARRDAGPDTPRRDGSAAEG